MSKKVNGASPPFRPDLSLRTYLEKGRSEEEMWAILEQAEDSPDKDEPAASENAT